MQRVRTLEFIDLNQHKKAKDFLNSKGRNSEKTKKIYGLALSHFQTFLSREFGGKYDIESILIPLLEKQKEIDVYDILDKFVSYLTERQDSFNSNTKLSPNSIRLYVAGVRSYLEKYDVDVLPRKFRNRVTMPRPIRRIDEPIDAEDIRTILLSCSNVRLKVFILMLASSGMRAGEVLTLRNCDLDFSLSPTKVHIIGENTKTKQARDVYISDEASNEIKKYLESKYDSDFNQYPNHLIFAKPKTESANIREIYRVLHMYFIKLLKKLEMDRRKDGQGNQRRKISFHLFRHFVKTTISNQGYSDFSKWLLGHRDTVSDHYFSTMKEPEGREIYKKCMKYLTFLDYPTVQSVGHDFESKLEERDQEIDELQNKIFHYEMEEQENKKEIENMRDYVIKRIQDFEAKTKNQKIKKS